MKTKLKFGQKSVNDHVETPLNGKKDGKKDVHPTTDKLAPNATNITVVTVTSNANSTVKEAAPEPSIVETTLA